MRHRILYYYPYTHAHTGSPRMLLNMIGALDREKFEPVFLAVDDGRLVDEMRAMDVEIVSHAVGVCSLRAPVDLAKRSVKLARKLKTWKIDLVHINEFVWNLDLGFGAWLRRIPLIIHSHNPTAVTRGNLMRFAADKFLFVSKNQLLTTQGVDLIKSKAENLYNFIDFDYFGSGINIRTQLGIPHDDFVVATIAQINSHKGIDTVIETAQKCVERDSNIKFLIIGGNAEKETDFANRMRHDVVASGLANNVYFLGMRTDIPDLLSSVDVLLHPTRREAFGLVVIEAMAAAKPVVAGAVGGIPEIMAAVGNGTLITDPTAENYADAIMQILAMPDHGKVIGERARVGARRYFSREAVKPQLEQIYDTLLNPE